MAKTQRIGPHHYVTVGPSTPEKKLTKLSQAPNAFLFTGGSHVKPQEQVIAVPPPRIDVIELASQKVVRSIALSSASDRHVERVLAGMLRNLDTEKYVLKEVL